MNEESEVKKMKFQKKLQIRLLRFIVVANKQKFNNNNQFFPLFQIKIKKEKLMIEKMVLHFSHHH